MKGDCVEKDDILETVDSLLNPKEDQAKSKISAQKKTYKKLILKDLKGKSFEFTGKLTLEIKGDSLIVKATK